MDLLNFNEVYVFDIECDSLDPSMIHVFSVTKLVDSKNDECSSEEGGDNNQDIAIVSTSDYEKIKRFFTSDTKKTIVGHNIIQYDIPAIEKVLGIKVNPNIRVIDTLGLAWYLYSGKKTYSLGSLGREIGLHKKEIKDWTGLSYETYKERCEHDVFINFQLYKNMVRDLLEIYDNMESTVPTLDRITFKLQCLRIQSVSKWKLDVAKAKENLIFLDEIRESYLQELRVVMPKIPKKVVREKPDKMFKKDHTISVSGYEFLNIYFKGKIPPDELWEYTSKVNKMDTFSVEYVTEYEDPNPQSVDQVKSWLFKLGWKPDKYRMELVKGTKEKKFIPEILNDDKELTRSVNDLMVKINMPQLKYLEHIGILTHRIGILNGFLKNNKNGYLTARSTSFTNTLRLKHSEIVNLPKTKMPYGKNIRECLIADEGYELCESDMASLENTTRNHFIYDFDPNYVESMGMKGFDSHLDLAVIAGLMTDAQSDFFKWFKVDKN